MRGRPRRTKLPHRREAAFRDSRQTIRRIVLVAFPDSQILDVTGPHEVFGRTNRWLIDGHARPDPAYRLELVAPSHAPLLTSSGLRVVPDRTFADVHGPIDTLIVAGGRGIPAALRNRQGLRWLRRTARRARRIASVCTGSFLLAEIGLLDGRRATTHWSACDALARRYPRVGVDPDPIFVRDGDVYTSAGVTAGMDLALALVEEDHGREVALGVARELVLFLRRPGGQSQFSAQLAMQAADRQPIRELQAWVADHLAADLSVPSLASRAAMSPRNFARVFTREVGTTPARYVESTRVEAARRRLEESTEGVDTIAVRCGFGTAETMRRSFLRCLHVPPTAYRNRFRAAS
jgi:transcriptional regulator GlxA family with amidase domain